MLIIYESDAKEVQKIPSTVNLIINETISKTIVELIFSCDKVGRSDNFNNRVVVNLLTIKNARQSSNESKF